MSIENGCLISLDGSVLHWHSPVGRSSVYLPDSRNLWDIIWENRNNLYGFAHSHPGSGVGLGPSWEDITTFSAIEIGLGKRLVWPIINRDHVVLVKYSGPKKYHYDVESAPEEFLCQDNTRNWISKLRHLSYCDQDIEEIIIKKDELSPDKIRELGDQGKRVIIVNEHGKTMIEYGPYNMPDDYSDFYPDFEEQFSKKGN